MEYPVLCMIHRVFPVLWRVCTGGIEMPAPERSGYTGYTETRLCFYINSRICLTSAAMHIIILMKPNRKGDTAHEDVCTV